MRCLFLNFLAMVSLIMLTITTTQPAIAKGKYTLTIYVNEGHGEPYGHVFVGLSDGTSTSYHGFYSEHPSVALLSLGGGQVRDDSAHAARDWDVKRTYNISKAGFHEALDAMNHWATSGKAWGIMHHCGDFVETIAKRAGVPIDLPRDFTNRNRPKLFGDYLRNHGGVINETSTGAQQGKSQSTAIIVGDIAGDWDVDTITTVLNQPGRAEESTTIRGASLLARTTKIRRHSNGSYTISLGDMIPHTAPTTNDIPSPILVQGGNQGLSATGTVPGQYGDPKSFSLNVYWTSQDRLQLDLIEGWSFGENNFKQVTRATFHRGRR